MTDPLDLRCDPGSRRGLVRSLYVHAPFCASRCLYCDFSVEVSQLGDVEGWLDAVQKELALTETQGRFPLAPALETLFVGGGTPSVLGPQAMMGLARILGPTRMGDEGLEWTVEANPESFTAEVAQGWYRAGVNRISLGVQSFQPGALEWMGRLHGPEGGVSAVARARAAGFANVSIDLIFGLPAALARDWEADLDRALALEVSHLSLYGLSVEPGTPLGRAVSEGRETPADEKRYREEYLLACERLTAAGFLQYELSNFARAGSESRHNQACWSLQPYLGLGNAAHSYRYPLRSWNLREWNDYQGAIVGGIDPTADTEELTPKSNRLESIWLGLRTRSGLSLAGLSRRELAVGMEWEKKGWARRTVNALHLTPEGWLILDRLAVELDGAEDGSGSSP